MKKTVWLSGVVVLMAVVASAEMRSSVSQWGITWTFDQEYECGQFVNGDWWVKGPVTVSSVYPRAAIFSPAETGDAVGGYLWWSGTYWCVSQEMGVAAEYHWRNYSSKIDTIYSWWDGDLDRSNRHDRDIDMQALTRTFATCDQSGDFTGTAHFASSSGLRAWDEGAYLESAETLNSKPVYILGSLINGSMTDPITGTQGYDTRTSAFSYDLMEEFPLTLSGEHSLVSSIGLTGTNCTSSQGDGNLNLAGTCIPYRDGRPMLKTAAVLTVVGSDPGATSFRPAFCGTTKVFYTAEGLRTDLLPELAPVPATPELAYYERGLERPWLSHIGDAVSRTLHPMENMFDYHEKIFSFYKDASLLLMLDLPDKGTLLTRYVQNGIDMYHMVLLGHGGSGTAKWPILFAGLMLDDADIKNMFTDSTSQTPFREDWMSYYGSDGTSSITSGIVADNMCWTGYTVPSGDYAGEAVMWRQDPGDAEHEHLHPSEWGPVPPSGGGCKHETYRLINSTNWPGMGLCALLMDGKDAWNHDSYFDYIDRWMNEDMTAAMAVMDQYCSHSGYQSAGSVFANQMWAVYRDSVPDPAGITLPDVLSPDTASKLKDNELVSMDGRTPAGAVRSGVYLYRYTMPDGSCLVRKVVIVR